MKSTVSQINLHTSTDRAAGRLIDGLAANAAKNQLQHLHQLHPQ
jgi:hypothetical protein